MPGTSPAASTSDRASIGRVAIVGRGRVGFALAAGLRGAGVDVDEPLGRGADGEGADVVILCVPDREIAAAAKCLTGRPVVGHCSASTPLTVLEPYERFLLHPLLSIVRPDVRLAGATCAVDGDTPHARDVAMTLCRKLGMRPVHVPEEHRALYHAAASLASNYLVTIEAAAAQLAAVAGIDRAALLPLVRGTVESWSALGEHALTGPLARGDEETVQAQRNAVAAAAPELLPLWDALVNATHALATKARVLGVR